MNYIFVIGLTLVESIRKITFNKLLDKTKSASTIVLASINKEIDFLTNNKISYIPRIISYERDKYILYEYIDGYNLKEINPNLKDSINIIIKLCNILKDIHDLGYCHNDIKRSNIMICNNDVYLIDFGNCSKFNNIANFYSPKTASYELLNRDKVNYLSDIYSIGKVLKELVSNDREDLNRIVNKCPNQDKSKRYQSVIELKNDLLKITI